MITMMVGAETLSDSLENREIELGNVDEVVSLTADHYSQYLDLEIDKEKTEFTENVDELLTRLDEFCGMIDVIRSDTTLCLGKTLPAIQAKSQQMNAVFDRIDQLEAFVNMVKGTVQTMESKVNQAENDIGSSSPLQKIFNVSVPFFSKKQTRTPVKTQYEPPVLFKTEDYLHYPDLDPLPKV